MEPIAALSFAFAVSRHCEGRAAGQTWESKRRIQHLLQLVDGMKHLSRFPGINGVTEVENGASTLVRSDSDSGSRELRVGECSCEQDESGEMSLKDAPGRRKHAPRRVNDGASIESYSVETQFAHTDNGFLATARNTPECRNCRLGYSTGRRDRILHRNPRTHWCGARHP